MLEICNTQFMKCCTLQTCFWENLVTKLFLLLQLISQAIITAARELHAQSHSLEDFSLSIPVVHVAHGAIEKRLSNLSNLIKCQPDVVTNLLRDVPSQESEMVRLS